MEFTKQNIDTYLQKLSEELANEYRKSGIPPQQVELFCFGGVVITHLDTLVNIPKKFTLRKTTEDIDVMFLNHPNPSDKPTTPITLAFLRARGMVTLHFGLPYNWINDHGATFVESYMPDPPKIHWRDYGYISLYFPTLEAQFVLKVLSGRLKDKPDVEVLCQLLGIKQKQDPVRAIIQKYIKHPDLWDIFEVEECLKRFFKN